MITGLYKIPRGFLSLEIGISQYGFLGWRIIAHCVFSAFIQNSVSCFCPDLTASPWTGRAVMKFSKAVYFEVVLSYPIHMLWASILVSVWGAIGSLPKEARSNILRKMTGKCSSEALMVSLIRMACPYLRDQTSLKWQVLIFLVLGNWHPQSRHTVKTEFFRKYKLLGIDS